jgi:uncharacterized membrane protein
LHEPRADGGDTAITHRNPVVVLVGYIAAILIGLAYPLGAVAMYLALAILLIVPFQEVGRVLFRPSWSTARASKSNDVGREKWDG